MITDTRYHIRRNDNGSLWAILAAVIVMLFAYAAYAAYLSSDAYYNPAPASNATVGSAQ